MISSFNSKISSTCLIFTFQSEIYLKVQRTHCLLLLISVEVYENSLMISHYLTLLKEQLVFVLFLNDHHFNHSMLFSFLLIDFYVFLIMKVKPYRLKHFCLKVYRRMSLKHEISYSHHQVLSNCNSFYEGISLLLVLILSMLLNQNVLYTMFHNDHGYLYFHFQQYRIYHHF